MNSVHFQGNVGDKPEPKAFERDGKAKILCRFPIAVYMGKEKTMWIDVVCFDDLADDFHANVQTGYKLEVKGRLDFNTYERDGRTIKSFFVVADWIRYWEPRNKTTNEETAAAMQNFQESK